MASIPAPKNKAVDVLKVVLDRLIDGAGVELAFSAAVHTWPSLNLPVVRTIVRWIIEKLAEVLDTNLFTFAMKIIIRVQSTARKDEFNEAMIPIVGGNPSEEEIERAREAARRLIERGNR